MCLESRAAYGYYGESGGASGETKPRIHKRGWTIKDFYFDVQEGSSRYSMIFKSCDYQHAISQVSRYCKKNQCILIGDTRGYEVQRNI